MRTILYAALGVLGGIYLIIAFATVDRRSDEARIAAAVESAAAAAENHSLNGVISHASKNYKDAEGMNYDRLRLLVAQALREDLDFRVQTRSGVPAFDGEKATLPVRVRVTSPSGGKALYDRELTVYLAREQGRHMLIIPVEVWRVVSVDGLSAGVGDL